VYALRFADATFDVVHAHQVLQHLADPVAALREMRRVCRPGGLVAARDADYFVSIVSLSSMARRSVLEAQAHAAGLPLHVVYIPHPFDPMRRNLAEAAMRDLAALMEAGFPLYDERYDGKVYWRLNEEYKGLPLATLSLSETAALYFSKKLVVNLAAPPFSDDIASAFKKIESALPDRNIKFLDSLDSMISVRADAPSGSYRLERGGGRNWESVANFPIHVTDCH